MFPDWFRPGIFLIRSFLDLLKKPDVRFPNYVEQNNSLIFIELILIGVFPNSSPRYLSTFEISAGTEVYKREVIKLSSCF